MPCVRKLGFSGGLQMVRSTLSSEHYKLCLPQDAGVPFNTDQLDQKFQTKVASNR